MIGGVAQPEIGASVSGMNRPDQRPEWSATIQRLSEGRQVFAWPGRDLVLERADDSTWFDPPGRPCIIVHRGRFGLGTVVDKEGLRALDVEWLNGEPRTAQVYLRRHQVRALVSERRQSVAPAVPPSEFVGKPVRDGFGGPEVGRIIDAEVQDGQVSVTVEHTRRPPSRLGALAFLAMLGALTVPGDDR